MKLPIDQRSDGEATYSRLDAVLAAASPETTPTRWRTALGAVVRFVRLVVDGPEQVMIPDRLREDAGLPPAEEPRRRPSPFDRPPLW